MSSLRYLLLGLGVLLAALPAQAQPERPATQRLGARPLAEVERLALPPMDNAALLMREEAAREEAQAAGTPRPLHFAEPVDLALSPHDAGTWETLADGSRAWRLVVASPGAHSLNVGFSRFRLPEGAALWLYAPGEAPPFRAFTAADNAEHGELWTPLVPGDEMVIELDLPKAKPGHEPAFELEVGRVSHAFRPFGQAGGPEKSGSCNVDVVCPEGDLYRDIIRSVGAFTISGTRYCSGAAVNNTAQDGTPYFLTAHHCNIRAHNQQSVVIYWNYENSTCRPPGSPASGGPGDGTWTEFSSGTILRGSGSASDWALVETVQPIPDEYGVYLAGWDRRDQATSSAVAIHHPGVEEKRISFDYDPTVVTDYGDTVPKPSGTHIRVIDWDLGTTEGGSSGSPLFSPEKRIVGQLHGGYAACSNNSSDWYGRVYHNMITGLATWLDPGSTGLEVLDGMESGAPPSPVQLAAALEVEPETVSPGDTASFTLTLHSLGSEEAEGVVVENRLPALLGLVEGSLTASAGEAVFSRRTVTWTVDAPAGESVTLAYDALVDENAPGLPITNAATVMHDSLAAPLQPAATLDVFVEPDFAYTVETSLSIPDAGCPTMRTSALEVSDEFDFIQMKVGVGIEHGWRGDLRVQLTSPSGTVVNLLDRPGTGTFGTNASNLDALFSDTGEAGVFGSSGDHDLGAPHFAVEGQTEQGQPGSAGVLPLSSFEGEDPVGTWTLGVCDGAGGHAGRLVRWGLFFYAEPTVEAEAGVPLAEAYRLEAAFPNPFAEETLVRFAVREAQEVRAEVYDALGRLVRVLHDGPLEAGQEQALRFDARGLASGTYVVRLTGEAFSASQKVLLVR